MDCHWLVVGFGTDAQPSYLKELNPLKTKPPWTVLFQSCVPGLVYEYREKYMLLSRVYQL